MASGAIGSSDFWSRVARSAETQRLVRATIRAQQKKDLEDAVARRVRMEQRAARVLWFRNNIESALESPPRREPLHRLVRHFRPPEPESEVATGHLIGITDEEWMRALAYNETSVSVHEGVW